MGRSYREELDELAATQARVPAHVPELIAAQAIKASDSGLIVVASGGAKVVAEWASNLQRMVFGCAAVAMTPLEYAALPVPVRATTWLISAGGRHPDIQQAARVAAARNDACVVGLIGQPNSPLQSILAAELRSDLICFDFAPGGDGFLATNSVWAMACVLAKAYCRWLPSDRTLDNERCAELLAWGSAAAERLDISHHVQQDLVVLYDAWTALGAQDLEARLTETALANLWTTDFRNFGHGRHYWMSNRTDRTLLVSLSCPACDDLVAPTLNLLPSALAIHSLRMPADGIAGALASLAWAIHATAAWGTALGRDPGRPGVPRFGEELYEGGFPYPVPAQVDPKHYAVLRKAPSASGVAGAAPWSDALEHARRGRSGTPVPALVMDYDGTMVDSAKRYGPLDEEITKQLRRLLNADVVIGIATGRGDGVQKALREALPESQHWSRVIVGYHNGARVLRLDEPPPDLDGAPTHPQLSAACDILLRDVQACGLGTLRCRENQLTVSPMSGQSLAHAWRVTRECLDRHGLDGVRVWMSSHSVDVLSPVCSKLHVVTRVAKLARCTPAEVWRLGDRGAWPGNDWELLDAPLGVSVDECSSNPNACWNLLPPNVKGMKATSALLRLMQADVQGQVRFTDGTDSA